MAAHLLEPAIVGTFLAGEDRVHRRLHVVINPPRAGSFVEGESPVVGVEHHLLGLAWIGPYEWHPAVAEPHMSNLHRHGDAVDQHDLMAPVELIGFARIKTQRHKSRCRSRTAPTPPRCSVAPNGVVPPFIAQTAQVLEYPQQRHPLAPAPRGVDSQKTFKILAPRPKLWMGLNAALVGERGFL